MKKQPSPYAKEYNTKERAEPELGAQDLEKLLKENRERSKSKSPNVIGPEQPIPYFVPNQEDLEGIAPGTENLFAISTDLAGEEIVHIDSGNRPGSSTKNTVDEFFTQEKEKPPVDIRENIFYKAFYGTDTATGYSKIKVEAKLPQV